MCSNIQLYNGDCFKIIPTIITEIKNPVIVTDPPFNIGFKYSSYKDNLPEDEYYHKLKLLFSYCPFVVIHYAEQLFKISIVFNN